LADLHGAEESVVSGRILRLLDDMADQWRLLDERIAVFDDELASWPAPIQRPSA